MTLAALAALFTQTDAAALGILVLAFLGIGQWIERFGSRRRSVTVMMAEIRRDWMAQFAQRENRIFDSQIISNLRNATSFFASTTIFAIGGVLTVAGNADTLGRVTGGLFADERPVAVHQVKLFLVALFLTAAFIRFVFANRVFGYCAVVMAAVPPPGDPAAPRVARQAAELNIRAAFNFNRGLRAIYFALAALTWLLGAIPLILATAATAWTLWEREFMSEPYRILRRKEETE